MEGISKDIRAVIAQLSYRENMNAILGQLRADFKKYGDICQGDHFVTHRCNTLPIESSIVNTFRVDIKMMILLLNTFAWKYAPNHVIKYGENLPGTTWFAHHSYVCQDNAHKYWVTFCSDMNGLYYYIIS